MAVGLIVVIMLAVIAGFLRRIYRTMNQDRHPERDPRRINYEQRARRDAGSRGHQKEARRD